MLSDKVFALVSDFKDMNTFQSEHKQDIFPADIFEECTKF